MKQNKLLQLLRNNARAEKPIAIRADAADGDGVDGDVTLYIDDVIDSWYGVCAKMLVSALATAGGKDINLRINSPGGDVFEARAMAAAIVAYEGKVVAYVDGVCASAATYLALACNEVRMSEGALFMVHNSWTMAMGDKNELRDTANLLDKIDGTIVTDYCRKTGASAEQVVAWMDATTWFTAQEALDAKLVDAIEPNSKAEPAAKAMWDLSVYPNAPQQAAPEPDPKVVTEQATLQAQRNRNRLRLLTPI